MKIRSRRRADAWLGSIRVLLRVLLPPCPPRYFEEIAEDLFHGNYSQFPRVTYSFHCGGTATVTGTKRKTAISPSTSFYSTVLDVWG